jgi:D-sedoheptulose 7-phosphate isomerase
MNDHFFSNYFESISVGIKNSDYFKNREVISPILFFEDINNILQSLRLNNDRIFFFGNGASAAFANHMALDFSKNGNILSRSLSDSAMLTALSNDFSYEDAMVAFLNIEKVTKNDLIITISSSGNSKNIINVLKYCNDNGIKSLALSGLKSDNMSISLAHYSLYVPMKTYGIVECIHQILLHLILDKSMGIHEWDRSDFQNMNIRNFKL